MQHFQTHVQDGGRIVIPAALRRSLGLKTGDSLHLTRDKDGSVRISTAKQALENLRQLVRKYNLSKNIVDEFIAERRAEAARE